MPVHSLYSFLSITACSLLEQKVSAAFASDLGPQGDHLASVFNFYGVPFVQANPSLLWNQQRTAYGSSVNVFPDRKWLTRVCAFNIPLDFIYRIEVFPQMLMDTLEASKLDSLAVFYYEESDVLLWKDFITAETRK